MSDTLARHYAAQVIENIEDEQQRTLWVERHVPAELHDRVWRYINLHYCVMYIAESKNDEDRQERLKRLPEGTRGEVLRMVRT